MAGWDREDMRIFLACLLFNELRDSEHSKYAFTWQGESADIATILEALFTAGGGDHNRSLSSYSQVCLRFSNISR